MKGWTKLLLDIVMGAVIPILILNNLTRLLGAPIAYVIAALVPVAYVLADTFLISRRFNAITTYVALTAIMNGMLAFWFVDGWRYALKDTAGLIVAVALFFGSLAIGKPMFQFFIAQVLQPDTPKKNSAWRALVAKPEVKRGLITATALIGAMNAALGVANFLLNVNIVTAPFGTDTFNGQVAEVNAITRIAFTLASFAAFAVAFYLAYRALFQVLPSEEGKSQFESEFWDLVRIWEQRADAQTAGAAAE
ncbi:MAG: VC0807 family protein [Thermoflexales bacterium]